MSRIWRITPVLALVIAIALLLAGLLAAFYLDRAYKAQKLDEVGVQARILAATVSAALAFEDQEAAQEYVNALHANPQVRAAGVYDNTGTLFVSYTSAGREGFPEKAVDESQRSRDERSLVVAPIMEGNSRLGEVRIETLLEPVRQRLARYTVIALLITMASLVVGVLGAAHAAMSRANRELESRAVELASANDELQAEMVQRAKAEEALSQAQKMETIGQLTGGVAHDFNNLLTIILGNLDRVRRGLDDRHDPRLVRASDNAIQGAQRAATLTRSLLAFARRQPLDPKPIEANKLVSHTSELLRRSLGEAVTIETVLAGGLWRTSADPNQLENAILNLAVNARDAMPGGGKLTIETANTFLDARYVADQQDLTPGQYVSISVSDTGGGMSRDVIEKAFEPFFTTKDIGHGTGLGLSQVYGFVKQSGGHVKIYSDVGQGTTVKIYLPRLFGDDGAIERERVPVASTAVHRSDAVLVVEDEERVREHSTDLLRDMGFQVFEAGTGAAALDLLGQRLEIALLFTDIGLPGGMNGRQLAEEAWRRRPDLKVLFTTAYARNAIVHGGRLDPGLHLVTKPFTAEDLTAALNRVFDGASAVPCVLVVEDEVLVRMNAVDVLTELGFLVAEAGTAGEAITRAEMGRIGAALIDLGLPDRRGDALAAELREAHQDLPIVIASGMSDSVVRERFASDPRIVFLDKPYEMETLASALGAAGLKAPRRFVSS